VSIPNLPESLDCAAYNAAIAQAVALAIPENAIVVDESVNIGRGLFSPTLRRSRMIG
jgi:hypothetical protein